MVSKHSAFFSVQFIRFVVIGAIAALINLVSRYYFSNFLSFKLAVFFAYLVGMAFAFIAFKQWVFPKEERALKREVIYFVIVNFVALLQVWIVSILIGDYIFPMINFTFYPYDIAHILGVISPTFTSFLGHKYFTFHSKNKICL